MAEDSQFIGHGPCDTCGSSDGAAQYDDGHTYCFVCNTLTSGDKPTTRRRVAGDLITEVSCEAILARKLDADTCKHFGYGKVQYKGQTWQAAPYYDTDGNWVGQKLRGPDKKFTVLGKVGNDCLPFGAHCWPKTGRKLVVTEGEIDALTMSQVQKNRYPVVSIPNGASSAKKHVAANLEYYSGFDEVIIMFDMDEPGQNAARDVAEVLGPKRAKIASLPKHPLGNDKYTKDPNDLLLLGKVEELVNAMFRAEAYKPEGIVDMASLKDKVKEPPVPGLSWWSPQLTEWTYGIRTGELICIGAGTGVGKTDLFTQQMAHLITHHKEAVGVFSLEQSVVETAKRLAGKVAGRTFHIPDSGWTEADLDTAWAELESGSKVYLYDSFGANEWSSVKENIEYMHHAYGVRYFFLDHLTALAAAEEDERVGLEHIMADMGGLVKRLDIALLFISHLATPEKGSHEEGARVTLRHLKGSRAIAQWASFAIGLERNQQADDPEERHTTTVRCIKDRYTGRALGKTFLMGYDAATGRLYEKAEKQYDPFPDESTEAQPSDF